MNAQVPYTEALSMAKQLLRLNYTTDNDVFLGGLCLEGIRRLSTNETLIIKDCKVSVSDNKFYLPADCKQIIAFRFSNNCVPGFFVDAPFFSACGCGTMANANPLTGVVNIQGRWANLMQTIADDTEIEIAYQALNVDENGLYIMNEEMLIATSRYAAFNFALSYPESYSTIQVRAWKNDYEFQAAKCRGLAARRKFEQGKEQIKARINQMVDSVAGLSGVYGFVPFYYPTIR